MNEETGNNFQNFSAGNFDPDQIVQQTSAVIEFVVILDVSPSISSFQGAMNKALSELFMKELKGCHRKEDILIKCIVFNDKVHSKSGFLPILNLTDDYLEVKASGFGTAIYSAMDTGLKAAADYRESLEDQGIDVKTAIFIVTDGENNQNESDKHKVKLFLEDLKRKEAWLNSFSITMLGIGDEKSFRHSCVEMGLDPDKCLVTITDSAEEIRKAFGVVSQSVSSGAVSNVASF